MQAKDALLHIISQIKDLLDQIEPNEYRQPLHEFDGNTLGQHFRHILEFMVCLERGIPTGMVDYAARERNARFEDSPDLSKSAFEAFARAVDDLDPAMPLAMRAEFGGMERPVYASTLGRELAFVYDHAIHHLAIIKIGLRCRFEHIKTDRDLGVSPSTIKAKYATN